MANPQHIAFKTPTSMFPAQGPKFLPQILDFTSVSSISDDLSEAQYRSQMEYIQAVYIDNSLSAQSFNIQFNSFQNITVIAGHQGIYPIIVTGKLSYVATSTGAVKIVCIFLNYPTDSSDWGPVSATATFVTPTGSFTSRSGTITAGGTSQVLAAANANRKRLIIQNPGTAAGEGIAATESLFINFGAAAGINNGTSWELQPSDTFDTGAGPVTTQQIQIIAATTGHVFIAEEM